MRDGLPVDPGLPALDGLPNGLVGPGPVPGHQGLSQSGPAVFALQALRALDPEGRVFELDGRRQPEGRLYVDGDGASQVVERLAGDELPGTRLGVFLTQLSEYPSGALPDYGIDFGVAGPERRGHHNGLVAVEGYRDGLLPAGAPDNRVSDCRAVKLNRTRTLRVSGHAAARQMGLGSGVIRRNSFRTVPNGSAS